MSQDEPRIPLAPLTNTMGGHPRVRKGSSTSKTHKRERSKHCDRLSHNRSMKKAAQDSSHEGDEDMSLSSGLSSPQEPDGGMTGRRLVCTDLVAEETLMSSPCPVEAMETCAPDTGTSLVACVSDEPSDDAHMHDGGYAKSRCGAESWLQRCARSDVDPAMTVSPTDGVLASPPRVNVMVPDPVPFAASRILPHHDYGRGGYVMTGLHCLPPHVLAYVVTLVTLSFPSNLTLRLVCKRLCHEAKRACVERLRRDLGALNTDPWGLAEARHMSAGDAVGTLGALAQQPHLSRERRAEMIVWMLDVHQSYMFAMEDNSEIDVSVVYNAVHMMDHYFASCDEIPLNRLQLVGTTCLWIAVKAAHQYTYPVDDLSWLCNLAYTAAEFRHTELCILNTLSYDVIGLPTILVFLRRYLYVLGTSHACQWAPCEPCAVSTATYQAMEWPSYDQQAEAALGRSYECPTSCGGGNPLRPSVYAMCCYLGECALTSASLTALPPSIVALCIIVYSFSMRHQPVDITRFIRVTGYPHSLQELSVVWPLLCNVHCRIYANGPESPKTGPLYIKYATREHSCVATCEPITRGDPSKPAH